MLSCLDPVWWGAGMVICLEWGADLHTAQLMPLPLTVYCFSEIQIGYTFLVPAHPGSHGKKGRQTCVCVCVWILFAKHQQWHRPNDNKPQQMVTRSKLIFAVCYSKLDTVQQKQCNSTCSLHSLSYLILPLRWAGHNGPLNAEAALHLTQWTCLWINVTKTSVWILQPQHVCWRWLI